MSIFSKDIACAQVFKKGEAIKYEIKKLGVKLGDAILQYEGKTEVEGKPALLIIFTANGFNFYDEEVIYVDPDTYYPILIERDLNIFGRKEQIREEYDQEKGKINIIKTVGDKKKETVFDKGSPMENIYGFMFRYRDKGDFTIGKKVVLHLPTQDVNIEIEKKDILYLGQDGYDTYMMTGSPKKLKIWFDSGVKRIPLRIDGAMGIGNTSMRMVEYISNYDKAKANDVSK